LVITIECIQKLQLPRCRGWARCFKESFCTGLNTAELLQNCCRIVAELSFNNDKIIECKEKTHTM